MILLPGLAVQPPNAILPIHSLSHQKHQHPNHLHTHHRQEMVVLGDFDWRGNSMNSGMWVSGEKISSPTVLFGGEVGLRASVQQQSP